MNRHLYLLLPLLLMNLITNAQARDSAIRVAVVRHGRSASILYTMNGEPLSRTTVETLLKEYPASSAELDSFHRVKNSNLKALLFCSAVAITAIVIGNIQASQAPDNGLSNYSKSPFSFSLGLGSLLSILFLTKKNDHMDKAIQAYNSRF